MQEVHDVTVRRHAHGHHEIASAVFVGLLLLSTALVLAAEIMKPEKYEYHPGVTPSSYVIFDRYNGRASNVEFDSKAPTTSVAR